MFHHILCKLLRQVFTHLPIMLSVRDAISAYSWLRVIFVCTGRNSVLLSSGLQTAGPHGIGIIVRMAAGFTDLATGKVTLASLKSCVALASISWRASWWPVNHCWPDAHPHHSSQYLPTTTSNTYATTNTKNFRFNPHSA